MNRRIERQATPMVDWPLADREAWKTAIRPAQGFDEPGPAAHLAEPSKVGISGTWGRYLTFLHLRSLLDQHSPSDLTARASIQNVAAYAEWLNESVGLSSTSLWSEINRIYLFTKAVRPEHDWSQLRQLANRLHAQMERKVSVIDKLRTPRELRRKAFQKLRELEHSTVWPKLQASRVRDWLMIAMLASWPIRLRNLAEMRIGVNLSRDKRGYLAFFAQSEVKNKKRLEWRYPDDLTPWIDKYIEHYRPVLAGQARTDCFWLRQDGGIFTPSKLLLRLSRVTKKEFGMSYTTRFFRYSGATAIFEEAPEDVGMAAVLLGHKQLSTALKHYIHPATNIALHRHADLISKLSRTAKER